LCCFVTYLWNDSRILLAYITEKKLHWVAQRGAGRDVSIFRYIPYKNCSWDFPFLQPFGGDYTHHWYPIGTQWIPHGLQWYTIEPDGVPIWELHGVPMGYSWVQSLYRVAKNSLGFHGFLWFPLVTMVSQ